jgi:hypothetical protein
MMKRLQQSLVMSESEYRANLAGLNTFFGAVLGFVMAGVERLDTGEFALVLCAVSAIVVSILYVSASKQRLAYGILTLMLIFGLPRIVGPFLDPGDILPEKLQPTLVVWALLAFLVEFFPRRPEDRVAAAAGQPEDPTTLSGKSEPNTR